MSNEQLICPPCGAPLEKKYRFSKTIVCEYCGQTSILGSDNVLKAEGDKSPLTDYGSIISVGAKLKIKDTTYSVLGRVRFTYPSGFWDEWFLQTENNSEKEYWLQEDEGEYTLFERMSSMDTDFSNFAVGNNYQLLEEKEVFIIEKNTAKINGGEGELPFRVVPGEQADFVDGIIVGEQKLTSIEFLPEETLLYSGTPILFNEIKIEA